MSKVPSIHDYPSLAAFVRLRRMRATSLSVRKASSAAGFAESTWSSLEGGHQQHPSHESLHAIARVLVIRPYPLALIAGAHSSRSPLKKIGGLFLSFSPAHPWWRERGGNFLRHARQGRTLDTTTTYFQAQWPLIPELADSNNWDAMERTGTLPSLPIPPVKLEPRPTARLDTMSGGWLWALLDAACGDPERAYYLLPGLMYAIGRAPDSRLAQAMDDLAAWNALSQSYTRCYTRQPEAFDDAAYFEAAARVAQAMRESASIETSAQRLSRITTIWDSLSREQQEHVVAIVSDLSQHQGIKE